QGVELRQSTAYHHQTVGQVERAHQELDAGMRRMLLRRRGNWATLLKEVIRAMNIRERLSKKLIPEPVKRKGLSPSQQYQTKTRKQLNQQHPKIKEEQRNPRTTSTRALEDLTALGNNQTPSLQPTSKKLNTKLIRPFTIKKVVDKWAFKLKLPYNLKIYSIFHISLLKP
ncbi:hypothetical protein BDZ91DRAFT_622774, partial [Kalaharituber pfeilii]